MVLIVALVLAGAVVIPIAYWRSAMPGVWAASAAWSISFLTGLLALWLVHRFNGRALHQVASSTLVRMSIPLGAVLIVHIIGGTLAEAGFVYYILAFYLITLAVETLLVSRTLPKQPTKSQTG